MATRKQDDKKVQTYSPLSGDSGFAYEAIRRRFAPKEDDYSYNGHFSPPQYGVSPTGTETGGKTPIFNAQKGQSIKSPVTGARLGMSQWGKPLTGPVPQHLWGDVLAQNPQTTKAVQDAMVRYYGTAGEEQIVDIVNKIVNEGMPMADAMRLHESGRLRNQDEIYAGNLVAGEYEPAINQLLREMERQDNRLGININTQQAFRDLFDKDLEGIASGLTERLGQNADKIGSIYGNAQSSIDKAFADASSGMGNANDLVRQTLASAAQNAGVTGAEDPSFDELEERLGFHRGMNEANRAGAVGNVANLGADLQGLAQNLVGITDREYGDKRVDLIDEVLNNIYKLQYGHMESSNELGGQLTDLERQRAADLRVTKQDVTQERQDRERQTALDQLAAEIQRGTLGLQRQQLGQSAEQFDQTMGFNREQFEFDKYLSLQNLDMQRREFEAAMNATQDPLERKKLQAEIDNINARTQGILTDLANPGQGEDAPKYKNLTGVQQYLADSYPDRDMSGYFTEFQNMMNKARAASANSSGLTFEAALQNEINKQPAPNERGAEGIQQLYNTLALIMANKYSGF